jgi:hypothetical protein
LRGKRLKNYFKRTFSSLFVLFEGLPGRDGPKGNTGLRGYPGLNGLKGMSINISFMDF